MSKTIAAIKIEENNFQTEFELVSVDDKPLSLKKDQCLIAKELQDIEQHLQKKQALIDEINTDIERLTNNADSLDYTIAVASGVLTGLIDVFCIGEFDFSEFKADTYEYVNRYIEKFAKEKGYKGQGLKGAISFLEDKFKVDQDDVWKGRNISSTRLHHLEDIAHHPTILGLLASIVVAFFRMSIFVDKNGEWNIVFLKTDKKKLIAILAPIVMSAVLGWLIHIVESKYIEKEVGELPKPIHKLLVTLSYSPMIIQVLKVIANWHGHLVSDMGGSKNKPGGGMGIPGFFISSLKEISSLPFLKDTKLPKYVSDLYSKEKWDLRSEMAVLEYVGKQSIPVILNELLVRTFYFVRHLVLEYKQGNGWNGVNWDNVVPWRNRTIIRMMTIASGTLVAVDAADASIRAALKSGGEPNVFLANLVLRINFVGIGRFAIAIGTDIYMGHKREKLRNERIKIHSQMLHLQNAKVFYKQADLWMAAEEAEEAIAKMEETASSTLDYYIKSIADIGDKTSKIVSYKTGIEGNNEGLLDSISKEMSL